MRYKKEIEIGCRFFDIDEEIKRNDDEEIFIDNLKRFLKDTKINEGILDSLIPIEEDEHEEGNIVKKDLVFPDKYAYITINEVLYEKIEQTLENYSFDNERIYFRIQKAFEKNGGYNNAFLNAVKEIEPLEEKTTDKEKIEFSFKRVNDDVSDLDIGDYANVHQWYVCAEVDIDLHELVKDVYEKRYGKENTLDKVYKDYVEALNFEVKYAAYQNVNNFEISDLKPISENKGYFTVKTKNDNLFAFCITTDCDLEVKVKDDQVWKDIDVTKLKASYDIEIKRTEHSKYPFCRHINKDIKDKLRELDYQITQEKEINDKSKDDNEERDDI